MAWIELHQAIWTHRKTLILAAELDIDETYAAAHMIRLWTWALDNAPEGDLSGLPAKVIAYGAGWRNDPDTFVEAAVRAGWLDRDGDRLVIHDWQDYAGRLIEKRRQDAERKRQWREEKKDVQRTSRGRHEDAPQDGAGNLTLPNQEEKDTPEAYASGGQATETEPAGSGSRPSKSPRPDRKPTYDNEDKRLVAELRAYREKRGCPPTQRDWHLRELGIIARLRAKYSITDLQACFEAAQRDPFWSKQLDSWATIERFIPKWRLRAGPGPPETLPQSHEPIPATQGGVGPDGEARTSVSATPRRNPPTFNREAFVFGGG